LNLWEPLTGRFVDNWSIDEYHEDELCGVKVRHGTIYLLLLLLIIGGCKSSPNQPENLLTTGSDLAVTIYTSDEFNRDEAFAGSATLSLTFDGRTISVQATEKTYTFHNVPDQLVILRAVKPGFFPQENASLPISCPVYLRQIPTADSRIDTIQCSVVSGQYNVGIITHNSVPLYYVRNIAVFVGSGRDVSPILGTYFADGQTVEFNGQNFCGATIVANPPKSFPSGTTVYITARVMSGASEVFTDTTLHVHVYTNLDQNPPFVLPVRIP
jgi:hypothetical protein